MKRYDGSGSRLYMRFQKPLSSAQGMGIFDGRAFVLYDSGVCAVYDLCTESPEPMDVFRLGSYNEGVPVRDYRNHANSCMFSKIHLHGNPIPLLYVTIGSGTGADADGYYYRCAVENITCRRDKDGSVRYAAETVQTITFLSGGAENSAFENPCWGCPAFLMDPEERVLYIFSARYRTKRECLPEDGKNVYVVTKFRLPELSEGTMVRLTQADILDQFTAESDVMFTQGGTIANGMLLYTFGCPKSGYPTQIMCFDLRGKRLCAVIDNMSEALFMEELECCAVHEGKLMLNTCEGGIYELRVREQE